MKTIQTALLVAAVIVAAEPARAQVFGQYTGAPVVPVNGHLFGAYFNASGNVIGGLAQLRLSFYPDVDFGFQGGLTRLDPGGTEASRTTLRVGGDVRWQIVKGAGGDLTLGGNLGLEAADDFKVLSLGPSIVGSRTMGDGGTMVPYAGLGLLFVSRDAFGVEDSDLSIPLRLGIEARLQPELRLTAELQLYITDHYNDDVGINAGVNLPF